MTEGIKYDQGKDRMDLLPWDAVRLVSKVLTEGAEIYSARNWEKGMEWSRLFGAAHRHLESWWDRQGNDPDTGLSHLAHAACDVLMLLAYEMRMTEQDNRPGQVIDLAKVARVQSVTDPADIVDAIQECNCAECMGRNNKGVDDGASYGC